MQILEKFEAGIVLNGKEFDLLGMAKLSSNNAYGVIKNKGSLDNKLIY